MTNQIEAQRECFSRSELRQRAAVVGLSTMMKKLVSSSNKRILDPIFLTIPLIYNKTIEGNHLDREERAGCFALFAILVSRDG